MRILITGTTGLLGAHLTAHLLHAGHHITGTRRANSNTRTFTNIQRVHRVSDDILSERFEWVQADVSDILALDRATANVDAVIHSAALVSFQKKDRSELLRVNQEGTANVVNACIKNNVPKLIHVSSTSVFPDTDRVIDETLEFDPDGYYSNYGLSKHLAELEVYRGQEEGLNICIVNPAVILGYGDINSSSCRLFRQAERSFPFYSDGANAFVGVEDVCRLIIMILEKDVSDRFLCVSENLSFREVQNMMADAFGTRRPRIRVGKSVTRLAWIVASVLRLVGLKTLITRESARSANSIKRYSSSKVEKALNIEFTPINQVIVKAVNRFKKEGQH